MHETITLEVNALEPIEDEIRTRHGCAYGEWSTPEFVQAIRWGAIMRDVSHVGRDGSQFVVGSDVQTLEIPTDHEPFVALRLPDRDLGRPAGDFLFVGPRAATGPDGALHLFWGEPDRPPDREVWGSWTHTSLWYARYVDEGGWSEPVELLRRDMILWNATNTAVAVDSSGRVHVFVEAWTRPGSDALVIERLHISGGADGWQYDEIPSSGLLYATLAAGHGERMYFVYMRAAGARNPNSLFLRTAIDGRGWSEPQLVYASAGRRAANSELRRSPDGMLHLVWQDAHPQSSFHRAGFRYVRSADEGRTWSPPDDLAVEQYMMSYNMLVDDCGTVHIVYESSVPTDDGKLVMHLWYVRWQDGWTAPVRLFADMPAQHEPGLALDSHGRPTLYFSSIRETGPGTLEVGGFVSRLDVEHRPPAR